MDNSTVETNTFSCSRIEDLPQIVNNILAFAGSSKVWLFVGELGAGKTTLIKQICKVLGVKEEVTSPTFAIINEYKAANEIIYHFDFYRIKNEKEAENIGVGEYIYSGNYCFIEWPQKIENLLPDKLLLIDIKIKNEENRVFELTKYE